MANITRSQVTLSGDNSQVTLGGLLTEMQYIMVMESCYIVWYVMSFFGVVSNIINIRIFVEMGLGDGVTVSFLVLAIYDLAYLLASLSLAVSVSLYVCELKITARFSIDPFAVLVYSANVMILISITNVLTTTFLAVARCMCVAKPLSFKNTFTRNRATLFLIGFAIFAITIYTPILSNIGMANKFDKVTNITRLSIWMSPKRDLVKNNVWMVTEVFLPVVTQFITIVCVVIMSRCLKAASKFRHASVAMSIKKSHKADIILNSKNTDINGDSNEQDSRCEKISRKDLRVVQQVILISAVYIVCNIPKMLISFFTIIVPEFTVGQRYTRLYLCAHCLRKHFEIFNATVNLVIYYKYNTKFRSILGF